ncbi:MAG: DNA mismatch repair endonuclease MutL [Alphaproteobacteria bacterium]|nr:DNA mismatch repair endonuclease MutL [Alphaproteobacteria bacterium]
MGLRLLPPDLINKISAGEVLERPASAVKELVENSIDAGANKIEVILSEGGKSSIIVIDNGKGMSKDELSLCIQRHATSKLPDGDLFKIDYLGFRGEAIPSIGSVARMKITSKKAGTNEGWSISINGGEVLEIEPASINSGTKIEVRDLFFAVPARLKFLKTAAAETSAIRDILDKLALAYPSISFFLTEDGKKKINYPAVEKTIDRIEQVLGKDFIDNSVPFSVAKEGVKITGFAGLPTYSKATSSDQYFFVNNRPVKDKVLLGAIKGAYRELLPHDKFPALILFINVANIDVDMNVHPTKAEVRFRNANQVRGVIVVSVREAVSSAKFKTSTTLSEQTLSKANIFDSVGTISTPIMPKPHGVSVSPSFRQSALFSQKDLYSLPNSNAFKNSNFTKESTSQIDYNSLNTTVPIKEQIQNEPNEIYNITKKENEENLEPEFPPLGFAKAQLHETYIVSQTKDGIVIVDQHAAHERLTYEKISAHMKAGKAASQYLLIPEIVEVGVNEVQALIDYTEYLSNVGLLFEPFGDGTVVVRGTPAILGDINPKELILDLAQTLNDNATAVLDEKIKAVCARMACHGSIRAGRKMSIEEMNQLLRQMEETGFSGQCIHGRPTYIELKLKDIEHLFGRS